MSFIFLFGCDFAARRRSQVRQQHLQKSESELFETGECDWQQTELLIPIRRPQRKRGQAWDPTIQRAERPTNWFSQKSRDSASFSNPGQKWLGVFNHPASVLARSFHRPHGYGPVGLVPKGKARPKLLNRPNAPRGKSKLTLEKTRKDYVDAA
jgi:hypothetical protein